MKSSGSGWGLAACLLLIASVPLGLAWRSESARQNAPAVAMAQNESKWEEPGVIVVQLQPGSDDATLADLNARLHLNLAWDGPQGQETEIAQSAVSSLPRTCSANASNWPMT